MRQILAWRPLRSSRSLVRKNPFDYLELTSRCKTQNEFNRVHIGLENILTPAEFAAIAALSKKPNFPIIGQKWVEKILSSTPALIDAPRPFERRTVSDYVVLYQNRQVDIPQKSLLVVFNGNASRPMMPVPMFLQYLDSRLWDVVMLNKCDRNSYFPGLQGCSTDFVGLMKFITSEFHSAQYQRLITYGTSAGGFPAIWTAILMGGSRGISIGGGAPRPIPELSTAEKYAAHGVDIRFVFGERCLQDRRSAIALRELFSGRLYPIPDAHKHGVARHLLQHDKFSEFIQEMLA